MSRYLICSDIHLNLNRRFDDTVAALNQITKIVEDNNVQNVLILGDVYTSRRPTSKEREAFQTWVQDLLMMTYLRNQMDEESIVILRGNHDESPDGSHSFTEFTALDFPGVRVLSNPTIWRGYFLGHLLLKGAKLPNGAVIPEGYPDKEMTAEVLIAKYPNCKAYLLGDIHQYSVLQLNPFMAYCGGVEHENFGERGIEKGVILIHDEVPTPVHWKFIPIKTRKMRQYDLYFSKVNSVAGYFQ